MQSAHFEGVAPYHVIAGHERVEVGWPALDFLNGIAKSLFA
jgi:hypothetical protein